MVKAKGQHKYRQLTDIGIRRIQVPGRYPDGSGLYLEVEPSGSKRWTLRIMTNGKRRDLGLGGYQDVPLARAREKAKALREVAKDGGDVLGVHRKARAGVPTFKDIATKVHAANAGQWKNPKHAAQWITTLETYAYPKIGERPMDLVTQQDCLAILSPIWIAKPETARRVRQRLKTVFDWAKTHALRTGDNPVSGIEHGLPKQRDDVEHHEALAFDKMPALISAIAARDRASASSKLGLEFLILTATRVTETRMACWAEFDLAEKIWTIPPERMKADREHVVPLTERCLAILNDAKKAAVDGDLVFPGQLKGRPLSENTFNKLTKSLGFGDVTAHGFRSAFRDWAAERTNFPNEVCEMALAHTIGNKVEAAYRRGDLLEKRRALMTAWAAYLGTPRQDAQVLPLSRPVSV